MFIHKKRVDKRLPFAIISLRPIICWVAESYADRA